MPRGINWSGQANTIPLHIISKSVYRPSCTLLGASKRVPVPFAPQAAVPFLSACPCPKGIHAVQSPDHGPAVRRAGRRRPVNSQSTAALPGRRTEQHEAPLGLVPSAARDPASLEAIRSARERAVRCGETPTSVFAVGKTPLARAEVEPIGKIFQKKNDGPVIRKIVMNPGQVLFASVEQPCLLLWICGRLDCQVFLFGVVLH